MDNKRSLFPPNITYLIGAGASANAIPVVKDIPKKLSEMESLLHNSLYSYMSEPKNIDQVLNTDEMKLHKNLMLNFQWLSEQTKGQVSIDTYAKKLFLRGEIDDYRRLKITLTLFFLLYQIMNGTDNNSKKLKTDQRYDFFFANLIDKEIGFIWPSLKIITWNYDSQFELSYSGFIKENIPERIIGGLNISPKFDQNGKPIENSMNDFAIVKLNGIADVFFSGKISGKKSRYLVHCPDSFNVEIYKDILKIHQRFDSIIKPCTSLLYYSWDNNTYNQIAIEQAKTILSKTEILVIIGYSFPSFNRKIDKKILSNYSHSLLKRIYIQDYKDNIPNIITHLKSYIQIDDDVTKKDKIEITEWPDLSAFCIPYEY